jgi:hypothetical protein
MSLLWRDAAHHLAVPWMVHPGEEAFADHAMHVKDAGFAGFVQHPRYREKLVEGQEPRFNHKVWNDVEPEPDDNDFHHFEQHGEFSPEHAQRHQEAYDKAMKAETDRDTPDHHDVDLYKFIHKHSLHPETWENHGTKGKVDISGPVYATQSHVSQVHMNRYHDDKHDLSWADQNMGREKGESAYKGNEHPLFVTHQGRLHVIDGTHRVGAALQRGDSHIHGWHYDLDKHPLDTLPPR